MTTTATVFALVVALCAQTDVVHVGVWRPMSPRADRAMKLLVARYRARHKDVSVTLLENEAIDALGLVRRWCADGRSWRPELVVVNDLWLPQMFGQLEPLPDDLARRLKERVPAALLKRLSHGGKVYGVPFWLEPRLFFYWPRYIGGRDWRPASWYDVLDKAEETAKKRRVWPIGVPGRGLALAHFFLEVIWGIGGRLRDESGAVNFMGTGAERAMELMVRADRKGLTQPQSLSWTQGELEQAFAKRKIACLVAPASFEQDLGDGRYAVALLPGQRPYLSVSVDCLVAFAGCKMTPEALKLLAFLASPEGQACIAEARGLPFSASLARKTASTAALKVAAEGLGDIRTLPQRQWPTLVAAIERAWYLALSGRHSVSWALEEAQATYERAAQGASW